MSDPDEYFERVDVDDQYKEIRELMDGYSLDVDEAERVRDIMDEHGLDEDEAIELKDEL